MTDLIGFNEQLVVINIDTTSHIKTGISGSNFTTDRVKCLVNKQLGLLKGKVNEEGLLFFNLIPLKNNDKISIIAECTALVGQPLIVATKNTKYVQRTRHGCGM